MRLRSRILVALVALTSISASVAEGLWASSCAGPQPGGAMAGMDMSMPMGDGHPMNAPAEHEQRSDGEGCPLPALLGAGCLVSALPASTVQVDLAPSEVLDPPPAGATLAERLEITGLFRPPRQ